MQHDFDGRKYRAASRHQNEWGNTLLSKLDLSGNESVLDLGCGDGTLSRTIAEHVPGGSVLGVDASPGMLRAAHELAQDNLSFRQIDINALDFEELFDLVFSNAALHWVLDHKALLGNTYRALKPGGRIAWNFAGTGTCPTFIEVVRAKMAQDEYASCFEGFVWPWYMPTAEDYVPLVDAAGFAGSQIMEQHIDRYFSDADELVRWVDQPCIVPFLECVPEAKKAAFRDLVVDEMVERTRQPDGTHLEKFCRINVIGTKS